MGAEEFFAEGGVFRVSHDGGIAGGLKGEAVTGEAFGFGAGGGGLFGGQGEAGEFGLVGNEEFEGVEAVERILGVLGLELGELLTEFEDFSAGFGGEGDARATVVIKDDGEVPLMGSGEGFGFEGGGVSLDAGMDGGIEGER